VISRRHETLIYTYYTFILIFRSYQKDKPVYMMVKFCNWPMDKKFMLKANGDDIVIGKTYLFLNCTYYL